MTYEFAIKQEVLNSGETVFTPVIREKSNSWWKKLFPNPWYRLANVEGVVQILDVDRVVYLAYDECEDRIRAFKEQMAEKDRDKVKHTVLFVEKDVVKDYEAEQGKLISMNTPIKALDVIDTQE